MWQVPLLRALAAFPCLARSAVEHTATQRIVAQLQQSSSRQATSTPGFLCISGLSNIGHATCNSKRAFLQSDLIQTLEARPQILMLEAEEDTTSPSDLLRPPDDRAWAARFPRRAFFALQVRRAAVRTVTRSSPNLSFLLLQWPVAILCVSKPRNRSIPCRWRGRRPGGEVPCLQTTY